LDLTDTKEEKNQEMIV